MSSPWQRSGIAIAGRGAVLAVLLAAWLLPTPSGEEQYAEPVMISAFPLTVTAATQSARPGQRIGVVVEYPPSASSADVVLIANGTSIRREALPPSGQLHLDYVLPATGPVTLGAEIRDRSNDEILAEQRAATLVNIASDATVLVIADEPSAFAQSLRQGGWPVLEVRPSDLDTRGGLPGSYSMLVLDDIAATALSADIWTEVEQAVRREAMGLLVLGGPHSFGLGAYRESRLEALLPLVSEPPDTEAPASVMFLVDVSGSMGRPGSAGDRLQIANQSVVATARTLRPTDHVGLMSFSVEATEHLALSARANHAAAIKNAWPSVASGGTQMATALSQALGRLEQDANTTDILIMLTDGRVADDNLGELATSLASTGVKVIALLIDPDARQDTLMQLIESNGGRVVPVTDLLRLPELMRHQLQQDRPVFVAGPSALSVSAPATWLPDAHWPAIDGYVLTRPRQDATVHLVSARGDPIIASMHAGAGTTIAVTSGFSNWTPGLLQSEIWPALAGNLTRRLAVRDTRQFEISVDLDNMLLTVDMKESPGARGPLATLTAPSGTVTTIALEPHAPGQVSGQLLPAEPGQYLLIISGELGSSRHHFLHRDMKRKSRKPEQQVARRKTPRPHWLLWLALSGFVFLLWWERAAPRRKS